MSGPGWRRCSAGYAGRRRCGARAGPCSPCTSTTSPPRSPLAVDRRLDGAFNVAPDGWIPDAHGPRGGRRAAPRGAARARRRVAAPALSPAVLAYAVHPWVVANDRLRAEGWEPEHTNEEALVATHAASWRDVSPRRRQELALGVTGAALAGTVAGAVALIRRSRRRR